MTTLTARTHQDDRSQLVAYDHGAHLASWTLDGEPVIWVSPNARLDGKHAIRGGVPLCLPWFGNGPSGDLVPSHGPARTTTWTPVPPDSSHRELWAWELPSVNLAEAPGAQHLPGAFLARYAVSLTTAHELELTLRITNTSSQGYRLEAALHTYLQVSDLSQARILGLENSWYADKVTGRREHQEGAVRFTKEIDRVYDSPAPVHLDDPGRRHIMVRGHGSAQTVLWNPGAQKGSALTDLGDPAWADFVCVETAAIGDGALEIAAGQSVSIGARYIVLPYPAP